MKISGWIVTLILVFSLNVFAVCDDEPTIAATGKILKELNIKNRPAEKRGKFTESEIGLDVKASVENASWEKKGAEAAVLTVFVDGKYNQDAILFAGETTFEYKMLLGKFDANAHRITIVFNKTHSAPNASNVKIELAETTIYENKLETKSNNRSTPAYLATTNAPVIYLRPNTIDKFSDIPLLTYYEIFDEPENVKRIRYTTIFTNEDGGTQSAALMARWGRMTDIEWINEIRVGETGEILSEIYQGANHETKNFTGKRLGSHPIYLDATVNNNFADQGCSPLRVSPMLIEANLSGGSRETVMDANSWTYRIMAEEAIREGRVDPKNLGANTIDDLRNYLYVEVYSENEAAAVAVEIQTVDNQTIRSDAGDARLRVDRNGYKRIAVRIPMPKSSIKSASLICQAKTADQTSAACRDAKIIKFVTLDEKFQPVITANPEVEIRSLKSSEKLIWNLKSGSTGKSKSAR